MINNLQKVCLLKQGRHMEEVWTKLDNKEHVRQSKMVEQNGGAKWWSKKE